MFRREKRPPAPKVTSSNDSTGADARGVRTNRRTACSISLLTEVPVSEARRFNWASKRSSRVIVVRMMQIIPCLHQCITFTFLDNRYGSVVPRATWRNQERSKSSPPAQPRLTSTMTLENLADDRNDKGPFTPCFAGLRNPLLRDSSPPHRQQPPTALRRGASHTRDGWTTTVRSECVFNRERL